MVDDIAKLELTIAEQLFDNFQKESIPDMETVKISLDNRLSDELSILEIQIKEIEAWGARIGYLLSEANGYLSYFQEKFRPVKSKELSDLDRKSITEFKCIRYQNLVDKLEVLDTRIDKRISLAQSLLKAHQKSG